MSTVTLTAAQFARELAKAHNRGFQLARDQPKAGFGEGFKAGVRHMEPAVTSAYEEGWLDRDMGRHRDMTEDRSEQPATSNVTSLRLVTGGVS